jgi:hypothetical protein
MGRNIMLKDLVARVALVLFIIGLTTGAAQNGENSGAPKQQHRDHDDD